MNYEEFSASLSDDAPPGSLPRTLEALWYAHRGDWDMSHRIAQDIYNEDGSWIHANLHREEGDHGNAAYWYSRAGKPVSKLSVEKEREEITRALLEQ